MTETLIIALLINGVFTPQHSYAITGDAMCGDIRQRPSVVESWKDIYGPGVILKCVEDKK